MTQERIAVVGLGYVGLPLSLDLIRAGFVVHAIDASPERVDKLSRSESYIDDVSDQDLREAVATGLLRITGLATQWSDEDVAFIAVPTPLSARREPDLTAVLTAGAWVREGMRRGNLVVLQSTTFPGTTMGPLREVLELGGMAAGNDFGLAFAPERVSPGEGPGGSAIPRLVGGIDTASTERAAAILRQVAPSVTAMSSADAAELAKLFENVFRNVNIALVNELALICERLGLDVWEVIAGASTKPFGFMPFYPGPGVGGHCIPVDPYYLSARAREVGFHERFIETAGDINSQMPEHVVRLVARALNTRGKALNAASILVVGVAFKPGVSDSRNSPAAPIVIGLQSLGASVSYHDPLLATFAPSGEPADGTGPGVLHSVDLQAQLRERPDCVVIVTPHHEIDWDYVVREADLIVDTRNATGGRHARPMQVLRLGAGWS